MAQIKPFKAIRAKEELAHRIAALPYDVYNRQEAKAEVMREPLSFLKIDRAETLLDDTVGTYEEQVYQKAHDELWNMVKEGQFVEEQTPCYYIYELTQDKRSQTGIVACAGIDDYISGVIKKHENTRAEKELDRIHHVAACKAQTGPIFLAYHADNKIESIIKEEKTNAPLYDFQAADGVVHRAWRIAQPDRVAELERCFQQISHIYIADGHHRCASAVKVGLECRKQQPDYKGSEAFNYFLSVLFPDTELKIMDYNRIVKNVPNWSREELLEHFKKYFDIEEIGNTEYRPLKKGNMGMCFEGVWYHLSFKEAYLQTDCVEGLDVSLLQNLILKPYFQIEDPKTDDRIDFVGGIRGLSELTKRSVQEHSIAFSMYPTSIQELFAVADSNRLMPPKSTWFEPKLRSGLFIHSICEEGNGYLYE